ncbi:MAG: ester cyclase [Anaerolineae bacterium]|nr:ester cyclase [Anaerolineae bacterium]
MRRSIVSMMMLFVVVVLSGVVAVAQEDNAQRNKQIYLDVIAEYNAGNREAFYTMLTDPFMMNQGDATLYETTPDDVRGYDGALVGAMPDIQMNVDVIVAQGDWVAVHVTFTGTFSEPFNFAPFGPNSFPANNEAIIWTETDFLHFNADGLVDEAWVISDPAVLFGQMGIFPPMDEGDSETPLEQPVGYQTLSTDALVASYTSGMEDRNVALFQEQVDTGLAGDTSSYYVDPYISWNSGVPYSESAASEEGTAFFGMIASAMPDNVLETPIVVAEGDWVAVLLQISGTFTEDVVFFGTNLSATGEPIVWQLGLLEHYDTNGVIIEEFVETDPTPLLTGLGIMPSMDEGE